MIMSNSCACKEKKKQKNNPCSSAKWTSSLSLEPKAPAEGATPHWSGDAETASELTNKERKSEEVFSRNTRPAARLSLRKPQPKFPSKTLFVAGSKGGRRGEEGDEGLTTGYRIDCVIFCVLRGGWNGNRSWGEMTWEAGEKEVIQTKKRKKNNGEWSREWVRRKQIKIITKKDKWIFICYWGKWN